MSALENAKQGTFVLLQVGMRRLALPAGLVSELAPPVRLHTFPHCSPLIAGVVVRRGRTAEMQPPEPGGPAYVAGKLILEDEIVEVLDLEALIRTASATNQGLPEIQAEVRA